VGRAKKKEEKTGSRLRETGDYGLFDQRGSCRKGNGQEVFRAPKAGFLNCAPMHWLSREPQAGGEEAEKEKGGIKAEA